MQNQVYAANGAELNTLRRFSVSTGSGFLWIDVRETPEAIVLQCGGAGSRCSRYDLNRFHALLKRVLLHYADSGRCIKLAATYRDASGQIRSLDGGTWIAPAARSDGNARQ